MLGTTVLHDVDAGVATITLNRPEAGNAVLPEQRDVIIELLEAADNDPDVRVVALRSHWTPLLYRCRSRGDRGRREPANRGSATGCAASCTARSD